MKDLTLSGVLDSDGRLLLHDLGTVRLTTTELALAGTAPRPVTWTVRAPPAVRVDPA